MNLDTDLQRILNINAKIYNSQTKRQGKVISVSPELVIVDYGNKARSDTQEYDIEDFSQMLIDDVIVANSRLTMDSRDNFQIKPRVKSAQPVKVTPDVKLKDRPEDKVQYMKDLHPSSPFTNHLGPQPDLTNRQPAEVGYINFSTNNFSAEPKKGYTKVEYRKVVERVTLDLTSEQLEELREKGWVK